MCDQPHPLAVAAIVDLCTRGQVDDAFAGVKLLHEKGYSAMDIIGTLFRVVKSFDEKKLPEALKLEFIREIGFCHMRVGDGVNSLLQLAGASRRPRERAGRARARAPVHCAASSSWQSRSALSLFVRGACRPHREALPSRQSGDGAAVRGRRGRTVGGRAGARWVRVGVKKAGRGGVAMAAAGACGEGGPGTGRCTGCGGAAGIGDRA